MARGAEELRTSLENICSNFSSLWQLPLRSQRRQEKNEGQDKKKAGFLAAYLLPLRTLRNVTAGAADNASGKASTLNISSVSA